VLIVVSYDVANDRRRTRLAKELENFGRRVQYSVFECLLDGEQLERLLTRVLRRIERERTAYGSTRSARTAAPRSRSTGWGR
jgi:CRISPR-associated protein Cas2